jgi:conjugative transposon TraN protein
MFKTALLTMMYVIVFMIMAHSQTPLDSIDVTYNKTSSIIFPNAITSVDRGSRDVIAQKAKGVYNVLQVKAARRNFPETNLTVITGDGQLFHFVVHYSDKPDSFTLPIGKEQEQPVILFESIMTADEFNDYADALLDRNRRSSVRSISKNDMRLALKDIRVHEEAMFFKVILTNRSNINYDTEFLKFFVRDSKRAKRTATQELPIAILYKKGNETLIPGKSSVSIVFAVKKFTIPDNKHLVIQVMEENGGRHLQLKVKNKDIIHAGTMTE